MMSNTKWFLFVILLSVQAVYAQNSFIEFFSEVETSVVIYKPIDSGYNEYYPTDTIPLKSNNTYRYALNVNDWCVVRCQFPRKLKHDVFIQADETVRLNISPKEILFEGVNAAANNFSNNNIFQRNQNVKFLVNSIFNGEKKQSVEQIIYDTKSLFQDTALFYDIDSMYHNKMINTSCYDYLNKDMKYRIAYNLVNKKDVLTVDKSLRNDSLLSFLDEITSYVSVDGNTSSYPYGKYFTDSYSQFLFDQLNKSERDNLAEKEGNTTFGPYLRYLLMPEKLQLSHFFDALVLQYNFGVNEFDKLKMYNYLKESFPGTNAVEIVKSFIEEELKDTLPLNVKYIDNQLIVNVSDLRTLESFRSKYIFIDLWASWCMPCRAEFTHNKKLNDLLANYPNVEKLYLSIDDHKNNWEETIKAMRLSGSHLLATTQLIDELKKEIYNSESITVPRYVLLSPEGAVINNDLPRPSSIDDLKIALEKALTQ